MLRPSSSSQMTGEVGSYRYMAPELVKHEPYNAKADIYSWAVISWEILTVRRPYSSMNETTFVEVRFTLPVCVYACASV